METAFIRLLLENIPSLIIGVGVAATFWRVSGFLAIQKSNNLRTLKLIKLHSDNHPEDEGYLYDDSRPA